MRPKLGGLNKCTKDEVVSSCVCICMCVANANLEQFVRSVGGSYAQLLQQLHHQPAEPFEGSWQSDLRVYLYENILVGVHIKTLHQHHCCNAEYNKGLQECAECILETSSAD